MIQDITQEEVDFFVKTIKENYNYDFSNYATSSLKRRLTRLLEVFNVKELNDLSNKVKSDKYLLEKVVKEITVNTTEMFRDPHFWKRIQSEALTKWKSLDEIRIWHAGCSTGEEILTMLILLKEADLLHKAKLIGTDLNEDVMKVAETAVVYSRNMKVNEDNYKHFSDKPLLNYFKASGDKYYIQKELMEHVTFKKLDLVKETMKKDFDLILCRNVLIYFNLDLQDNVINNFADSLKVNGYLGIGNKETISWCKAAKRFTVISIEDKLYKKII